METQGRYRGDVGFGKLVPCLCERREGHVSPLYLPYISLISPLHLPAWVSAARDIVVTTPPHASASASLAAAALTW